MYHVLNTLINDDNFAESVNLGTGLKGKKIIIQGFGNVGFYFASYCYKAGAKIVGIIEKDGAIYNRGGMDPNDIKLFIS